MGSVLSNAKANVPVFAAAFLIAVVAIYAILTIRKILKERKINKPSFAKSSVRSEAPLDQLPKEILETIFDLLDARGISTASTTSKYWNYIINDKGIKQRIYDDTIASTQTSKSTLEQVVGQKLSDIWLKTRDYPADYPQQWIIQDFERWKIFDFNAKAPVFNLRNYFAEDPTLALRLRGQYRKCKNEDHWRFRLEKNELFDIFYIRKKNTPGVFAWPYFPCENILEDGAKYELIVTMSCIVFDPQRPASMVHQIRPLDGPAARPYTRVPRLPTMILSFAYLLISMFFLDLIFWAVSNLAVQPLPPMRLNIEEQCILCPLEPWSVILLRSFIVVLVTLREMTGVFKSLDEAEGLRGRIIKSVLWVIGNYVLLNGFLIYFNVLGWWFAQSTLQNLVTHELAKHSQIVSDIKKRKATRKFGNLITAVFICPILLMFMMEVYMQRNTFSLLAYLVHVIFIIILSIYGRFVYVNALRLLDPRQYAASPSLKKWFTWSLPVRWWFFITLVAVPMTTSVCSCLGPLLWE